MVLNRRLVTLLRHAVQNKGIFAELLTVSHGTPVFRVTPVEKHCSRICISCILLCLLKNPLVIENCSSKRRFQQNIFYFLQINCNFNHYVSCNLFKSQLLTHCFATFALEAFREIAFSKQIHPIPDS